MEKNLKLFLAFVFITVLTSISITFYNYVIQKDYLITMHIECDPNIENCFYVPCEDSDCPEDIEYYKLISKKAFNVDLCDSENSNCNPFVCKDGEEKCEIISCTLENKTEGEKCSTPNMLSY